MKNLYTLLLLVFAITTNAQQHTKTPFQSHDHPPGVSCPIGEPMPGFVIPPRAIDRNNANPVTFNVTYAADVPTVARTGFERATDILGNLLNSTVPVSIFVGTSTFPNSAGTLAAAGTGQPIRNFPNAPIPNVDYPIALAEKLAGQELNDPDSPFDIIVTYNSTRNWNFTSTSVAFNQFDFTTVILHEIIHGLGFASSAGFIEESELGFVRFNTQFGNAYTNAIENRDGENLVADFTNGSEALGIQLRSNRLFIRTASFANASSSEELPKLFAPGNFSAGSSISHLDEGTFNNTPNSLMTPSISPGAIMHDPGDLTLRILNDMGWSFTNVVHAPILNIQESPNPFEIVAQVISEQGYDPSTIMFHHSFDNFETVVTELMTPTGNPDEFTATLPAQPDENTDFAQYYITVQDSRDLTFSSPANAPRPTFHTYFYRDVFDPIIAHEPVTRVSDQDRELFLDASITDFYTGIREVRVDFRINGTDQQPGFLEKDTTDEFRPDLFSGSINLTRFIASGDLVEYRIIAIDSSLNENSLMIPEDGTYFEVEVSEIRDAIPFYVNDFEDNLTDFDGDFSITQPTGFSDNAIHSTHPYPNAGLENTLNFVYNLSFPIVVRRTEALIEFDEIVLVEPASAGAQFGDLEFWDFVIVEGRKIEESEWIPLLNGYDSAADPAWLSTYNGGLNGQDSNASGNENLYRPRTIDIQNRGDFVEGDTILIRFRLFSDPFAFGWGWAIDNLKIQDTQVSIEEFIAEQDFMTYPNPIGDQALFVEANFKQPVEEINLVVTNIHGQEIIRQNYSSKRQRFVESLDMQPLPKGVYMLTLFLDNQEQISRRIVKQ